MYSSLIIQSSIAIIALVILVGLEFIPRGKREAKDSQTEIIVTAPINFHKSQCFFASTIQIAALALSHDTATVKTALSSKLYPLYRDFLDTSILTLLATSGFVPIALTLVCITRYGRQEWYILLLSFIPLCLSTATLAAAHVFVHNFGEPLDFYGSVADDDWIRSGSNYPGDSYCNINGKVGESLFAPCGSSRLNNNALQPSTVSNTWIWLVWLNCIVCACIGKKLMESRHWRSAFHRLVKKPVFKLPSSSSLWIILFVITSGLCFASQFSLFSVFLRHDFISSEWSFGQIIAVTVWVPSVVEFLYIEYSR